MPILLSGSLAYDQIMNFPDSFKNHIMPDQIHILNVSFIVDELRKEFGGTAGNIAYTMHLLGADPLVLATLGKDGRDYLDLLKIRGMRTDYIAEDTDFFTASAHIVTDQDDNQITPFYPGALSKDDERKVKDINEPIELALISPTKKEAMIAHAKECADMNIPFVFDPGQQITAFTAQELMLLIGQASFLIANDYEMKLIEKNTGWSVVEMKEHVDTIITTLGAKGSTILTADGVLDIPAATADSIEDPTGAGDAYRAGFFAALSKGVNLEQCGKIGAVAAVYAVEHYGTQNHHYTLEEFATRYKETFGEPCPLS